jgi:XTP/dITP diphosphohydrolase
MSKRALVHEVGEPRYAPKIVIASNNRYKIEELKTVAKAYPFELLSPEEASQSLFLGSPPPQVEESGATYYENALLKAQAFSAWCGIPAVGDDSGLEVTALGGRPGLYSARYAGEGANAAERIEALLRELKGLEEVRVERDRQAFFTCTLVLSYPDKSLLWTEARLEGRVLDVCRGTEGFGYDPIIEICDLGLTLAEVDFSVTCSRGFRAKAARQLFEALPGETNEHKGSF